MPISYTHKTNPAEVLLTSWHRTGDDTFAVTARWPREHAFYLARFGRHDPLFLTETVRQTLPLLSHAAYDVPLGHQLLWKDLGWDVDPDGLRVEGGADAEIDLHITSSDVKYRKERATAVTLSVEAERAGRRLATARTSFTIHDRAVYERLRGRNADIESANARVLPLPPPSPTQHAGRDRYQDVVLSCTDVPLRWQLRTDTSHPVLFDHPVDHAPGMLLLEAARQATQSATHPRRTLVVGLSCDFTRYAEFDAPCWVTAKPLPRDLDARPRMLVTAEQNDEEVFTSVVTLYEVPADH
ncbi:ScbA/BarX family gamma-butyrolactone biosynthesis protein [Streptomyces torulosus]|uniref:ScbA/BarX family gamma-butyrolactone biosynthesis protein n=1 Tax=Streptomyces torulosus TaxID=68276 RepID=UPI0006EBD0A6|nr:ScbA/BarX family gamma-butyrolactone biosynthesis protein [Streptomyces torulosus]